MSSLSALLNQSSISILLHLLVTFLVAVVFNRFLKAACNLMIRTAADPSRAEQAREQQTRSLAAVAYAAASKVVWAIALLMALDQIGINPWPALVVMAVIGLAVGFGAQNVVRDVIAGCHIVLEDTYVTGDTVQIGDATGRVEQVTLRRTVVRDARGARVTIANGDIRAVANLSHDWSQAFVDVALAPEIPLEKPLAAIEAAAAELRNDGAWSQALVDGPRVLGVQRYDRNASVVRVQVRTLPMRHEEISRELRRRIQKELQKQGIPLSSVLRLELTNAQAPGGTAPPAPQSN